MRRNVKTALLTVLGVGVAGSALAFAACTDPGKPQETKLTQLSSPENVQFFLTENGWKIKWDEVGRAKSYTVKINNKSYVAEKTEYDFAGIKTGTEYTVGISAVGDGVRYSDSEATVVTQKAVTVTEGLSYTYTSDRKHFAVGQGTTAVSGTSLILPDYYRGLPVTEIADTGFSVTSGLTGPTGGSYLTATTVRFSVFLEAIGNSAFEGASLTEICLPDGIKSVGEYAFCNCKGLTQIEVPDGDVAIGNAAFSGTAWLDAQPNGFVMIGSALYTYKSDGETFRLKKEDFPQGVKTMVDGAFRRCEGLVSVELPDGLDRIGGSMFIGCLSLESVVLPEGITSIGEYAFSQCAALKSLEFPSTLVSIGNRAFTNSGIEQLSLGEGVQSIGVNCFIGCSSLTSVVLPTSLTELGENAFASCEQLTTVYYLGTEAVWQEKGFSISGATVYYYSESQPETEGNYWRYVDSYPSAWNQGIGD